MLNLDPFADNDDNSANQNNSSDPSDGIQDDHGFNIGDENGFDDLDDMMLDGGMHLMEDKRKQTSIFAPSINNNNMQHVGSKGSGVQ